MSRRGGAAWRRAASLPPPPRPPTARTAAAQTPARCASSQSVGSCAWLRPRAAWEPSAGSKAAEFEVARVDSSRSCVREDGLYVKCSRAGARKERDKFGDVVVRSDGPKA
eukprot:365471-Chlamydomonas_euryale.AAC.27